MRTSPRSSGLLWVLGLACGACGEPAAPIPREVVAEPAAPEVPSSMPIDLAGFAGGPVVRLGRLALEDGERRRVPADPCTEVFVHVESGRLDDADEGDTLFGRAPFEILARAETRVVVAAAREVNRPFGAPCPTRAVDAPARRVLAEGVPRLPFAGGKLHVRIFADESAGARHGAFSLLDGDDDLPVPPHVHDASVETLYVVEGDGTMLLGETESPLSPERVIDVPAGVRHGYEPGTTRFVAYQVYAPPGPEQRFRQPPTPPAFQPPADRSP